jgi:hypothetical protein
MWRDLLIFLAGAGTMLLGFVVCGWYLTRRDQAMRFGWRPKRSDTRRFR